MGLSQPFTQAGGTTYLNGGNLTVGGAGITLNGGIVKGGGTITAALVNNAGGAIDETTFSTYDTLTISGDYTQGANASLLLKIGRSGTNPIYDVLAVGGQANLGGSLIVQAQPGFTAQAGDTATILTFNSRAGDFATKTLPPNMTTDPQAEQYLLDG